MKKEDVDLYLDNVKAAQSDSEKLALTKEFYFKINESILGTKKNRDIVMYNNDKVLINHIVESGAASILHEIAAGEIADLSRVIGAIVDRSEVSNREEEKEKIEKHIDKLLKDPDMLPDNPTIHQVVLYDGLLTRKVYTNINEEKAVDEITIEAVRKLFSNLPEGKNHRATLVYGKQIFRAMNEREDIRNLIPKLPPDEYRDLLANLNKFSDEKSILDYDNTLNEFLSYYGDTDEVSVEERNELFKNIVSKYRVGRLMDSNTYTKYFMGNYTDDKFMTLYGSQDVLIRDVLARIYEKNGTDVRTTEIEQEIFKRFFMPKEHDISVEDPEHYEKMKAKFTDYDPKYTYDGIFKEVLSQLFIHSSDNWNDIIKYMIRLNKIFSVKNRPNDEFLSGVYDCATSLEMFDELKKNLTSEALKEYDPNERFNREEIYSAFGWEYTEEQRKIDEENERWAKETGYDPNRTRSGLRRVDCADIALELMLEADYSRALMEFNNKDNIINFKKYGRDLFNSRAVRKLVEIYVDTPNRYDLSYTEEFIIREFVDKVSLSPDFNIFNEQGVSELLQLGHLNMARFGKDMINLVRNNLAKNPSYQLTIEEAEKNIRDFISSIGDETIDASKENEFDRFLISLTKLKIDSQNGVMPKEAVDFLISQSMRSESLINLKKDKYGKVPERAIEDLGKIDNLSRNNVNYINRLYKVRDYIDLDLTLGLHCGKAITIKREQIDKLSKGEVDAVDTVFHENTHMTQEYRLDSRLKDYTEYLMKKEKMIRLNSLDGERYYDENYFQILIEIEAREVAARMTANYVARIAPKGKDVDIADSLKQDVLSLLIDRYKIQENIYKEKENEEGKKYRPALSKIDSDGKKRTINQIFDRRFQNTNVLKDFISTQPFAQFEYWPEGTTKTFSEQIRTVTQYSGDNLDFDFIRAIINYSGTAKNADAANTISALNLLINGVQGDNTNRGKFVTAIVEPNLPGILEKYLETTKAHCESGKEGTISMVDTYTDMNRLLNKINLNPNADWVQGFRNTNVEGKNSLQLMENYCEMMKKHYPTIDEFAYKLEEQRKLEIMRLAQEKARREQEEAKRREELRNKRYRKNTSFLGGLFGYKQMANISASAEGKRIVAKYEETLMSRENDKSTQEIND